MWFHDEAERYPCWSPLYVVVCHGSNAAGRLAFWFGIGQSVERPSGIFSQSLIGNWWGWWFSGVGLYFHLLIVVVVAAAAGAGLVAELTPAEREVVADGGRVILFGAAIARITSVRSNL